MRSRQFAALIREVVGRCVLAAFAVAVIAGAARVTNAQSTKSLFSVVDPATTDLNERQALLLERLRDRKSTKDKKEVRIVKLQDLPTPTSTAALALDIAPKAMEIKGYSVARSDEGDFLAWNGPTPQQAVSLAWTPDRSACAGLIYSDGQVIEVAPLGNGLQAMLPLDQSQFHPDEPPAFDKIIEGQVERVLPAPAEEPSADAPPIEITVLVAYTPRVQDNVGNIQATINGAVGVANTSYANSKVNARLRLVRTVEVDYEESGTHREDLDHFRMTNDGAMDEIHKLRDQHKADVCVLFIDNSQFCGLADAILADPKTAFAVVHYDCAVGNLSFAHEVGHLQGARHNLEVDDNIDPTYPWNHGYLIPGTNGRTVMAYPAALNPIRLPNWSNPDVEYKGVPTGTAKQQNNARMLNTSADYISHFR